MLRAGDFVLHLVGAKEAAVDDAWASWTEENADDPQGQGVAGEIWWHIGLHYFAPLRPTFLAMTKKASHRETETRIVLQATGRFLLEHDACAELDRAAT